MHNFLALNIPTIMSSSVERSLEKLLGFDIEIYGDNGYNYKGTIPSYQGIVPNFMIPLRGDKKIFININYKFADNIDNTMSKKFINFIEVPKRFQVLVDENENTSINNENGRLFDENDSHEKNRLTEENENDNMV